MTGDFQDLTREALQMEHERGQLDSLIDGLRDRCESLEGQLSDERVRWIGVKSPGETAPGERNSALPPIRETTSVMVMRQEFKRMMRETRAEGVRLLKVSEDTISRAHTGRSLTACPDRTRRTPQTRSRSPPSQERRRRRPQLHVSVSEAEQRARKGGELQYERLLDPWLTSPPLALPHPSRFPHAA
jgi:hypothetical protein